MVQTNQKLPYHGDVMGTSGKMHIKKLFIREGTVKRREETQMESFYYACLYDILQSPIQHAERTAALNHLKAKNVKLHNARLARGQTVLRTQDILQEEHMSLFQLIKRRQSRGQREISEVQVRDQGWQTSARDILRCSVSTCEVNIDQYSLMWTVSGRC
jgi:hypothetical protein